MNTPDSMRSIQMHVLAAIALSFYIADTTFAITIKKADMSSTTLNLEGEQATSNATIIVDGQAAGNADNKGKYKFSVSNYSSDDCIVSVSDGTGTAIRQVANCTPSGPPPNSLPSADAGPNLTIQDLDNSGSETVTLNGSASSDPDGSIMSWEWRENGVLIASGVSPAVNLTQGRHDIELTVTDDQNAAATDMLAVFVIPPQPAALPPRTSPDAILESNQAYSGSFDPALMGSSVASAGDVNGDGYEDVIVGARGWDTPGGLFDEGAVFIFHGGPNGIDSSPATIIQSNIAGAEFGFSVAGAGDVNGDGYGDIIVGAPFEDASGLSVSGAAYVFPGGPQGVTATSLVDATTVLESKQIEGWMGYSVAGAGDINGDGFDDVIVGAALYGEPFNPPVPNQGSGRQGAAFVFLGSATGIVGNEPANAHAQLVPWANGQPSQVASGFGLQVASAGDVNHDGYADVMVGYPRWNQANPWPGLESGDPPEEGAVFIFHGGPNGITATNVYEASTRIEGNQLEAWFGSAIASAGDVNGDSFGDIIVGAAHYPAGDPLLKSEEGAFFIFLGGPFGIAGSGPADAQTAVFGSELAEWLGRDVGSIGDFDGDGFADVIVGARIYPGSLVNEGIAYVFRGGIAGIAASSPADAHMKILSNRTNADLGVSVAGGDFDNDTLSDIIVGVPGYTGGEELEGAAFVYLATPLATPPNQPPVADAGPDLTVVDSDNDGAQAVTLNGTASFDVDGTITDYVWKEGATTLGTTATLTVPLSVGNHTLALTVTDVLGANTSDTVLVRVLAGTPNRPPVANAGPDQNLVDNDGDGVVLVTLDGTTSSDPDGNGTIVAYTWSEGTTILGTGVTLTVPLGIGTHHILLRVDDNHGSGSQDGVVITITDGTPAPTGTVSVSGSTQANRGDTVSYTVTLANTGTTPIPQWAITLTVSPGNLVKDMQRQGPAPSGDLQIFILEKV